MHNWSLVAFTLLIQSSVGLILTLLPFHWVDFPSEPEIAWWSCWLALVLSMIGLVAALGHLGTPAKALHAIRNLPHSWLSREIASAGGFTATLVLFLLTLHTAPNGQWLTASAAICSILGTTVLYTMVRVYGLKTVPGWSNLSTPFDFVGSALFLGGVLGFGITKHLVPGAMIGWATFVFITAGIICKVVAGFIVVNVQRVSMRQSWYADAPRAVTEAAATAFGIGLQLCAAGSVFIGLNGYDGFLWVVLALIFCGAAEVWGRWRFYDRYLRIGL